MSLSSGFGSIIFHMVIDMDETRLQTISQLSAFLAGTLEVHFTVPDNDDRRYACRRPGKLSLLLSQCSGQSANLVTSICQVHMQRLHARLESGTEPGVAS